MTAVYQLPRPTLKGITSDACPIEKITKSTSRATSPKVRQAAVKTTCLLCMTEPDLDDAEPLRRPQHSSHFDYLPTDPRQVDALEGVCSTGTGPGGDQGIVEVHL